MHSNHNQRVSAIATEVKGFFDRQKPFRIYHGSTNSTRILEFKRDEMIDVSQLNRVLSVDVASCTALVEPNVPMDKLVAETLKYGLIPPVVMEFPGITVGGGIQGGAGESSSFKYGCFNQTCLAYEMVLANGEVAHASPSENADLFYGTAGSYGTLGVITAATLQLIPAKRYVQLTYLPVRSFSEAVQMLERTVKEAHDFIDGIMFGPDHGVIIVGNLSNEARGAVQRFSRATDPWYCLHAEAIDSQRQIVTETVPLVDYLFRYDRGAFWVGRYAFEMFEVPFNAFTRWLLNPILHTRKLYQALQESGASQRHVVQDLALPASTAVKFMDFVDQTLHIYPLWLCPLKPDNKSPLQSNNLDTPLVVNVGVWGNRVASEDAFLAANKNIEHTLAKLGGKKWFYAHSYYAKDVFWKRYDKAGYDSLRKKYHATTLPDIYDKIRVKDSYAIDLKRGVYRTLFGRAKLRIKE
jgi:FAD/FMN-containing dehydrogenase